jgi:hypothetical protein
MAAADRWHNAHAAASAREHARRDRMCRTAESAKRDETRSGSVAVFFMGCPFGGRRRKTTFSLILLNIRSKGK